MLINEREYKLTFTGETLLLYKEKFHRDFLLSVSDPSALVSDYELLFSVIWALAKTNGGEIEDYDDFMKSLTPKAIRDLIKIDTIKSVTDAINGDMTQTVESKKK